MANYANTVLLAYLTQLSDRSNKDFRPPPYGATRAFNDYKREVIENFDELQGLESETDLQDRKVDYLRRDSQTVGSSRSASLTGAMGTSTRDSISFTHYTREFTISDDNARSNTQKAVRQFARQMENARLDIGAEIESDAVTKLGTYLNQVDPSSPWKTWDSTNY